MVGSAKKPSRAGKSCKRSDTEYRVKMAGATVNSQPLHPQQSVGWACPAGEVRGDPESDPSDGCNRGNRDQEAHT